LDQARAQKDSSHLNVGLNIKLAACLLPSQQTVFMSKYADGHPCECGSNRRNFLKTPTHLSNVALIVPDSPRIASVVLKQMPGGFG